MGRTGRCNEPQDLLLLLLLLHVLLLLLVLSLLPAPLSLLLTGPLLLSLLRLTA
jgi:hypothetical protein